MKFQYYLLKKSIKNHKVSILSLLILLISIFWTEIRVSSIDVYDHCKVLQNVPQPQGTSTTSKPQPKGTTDNSNPISQTNNSNPTSQSPTYDPKMSIGTPLGSIKLKDSKANEYFSRKELIKYINFLIISIFLFIISIFLMNISAKLWLESIWYRKNELDKLGLNDLMNILTKLSNMEKDKIIDIGTSSSFKYQIKRLKDRVIDSTEKLNENIPKFNLDSYLSLNGILLLLVGAFLYSLITIMAKVLMLDMVIIIIKYFNFPILISSCFLGVISLFRFILIQKSYTNTRSNNISFFGILVSLITLTSAIITIIKTISILS
jgi:hypothetical protein